MLETNLRRHIPVVCESVAICCVVWFFVGVRSELFRSPRMIWATEALGCNDLSVVPKHIVKSYLNAACCSQPQVDRSLRYTVQWY